MYGDITKERSSLLVSAANGTMIHAGGTAKVITDAAGGAVALESQQLRDSMYGGECMGPHPQCVLCRVYRGLEGLEDLAKGMPPAGPCGFSMLPIVFFKPAFCCLVGMSVPILLSHPPTQAWSRRGRACSLPLATFSRTA